MNVCIDSDLDQFANDSTAHTIRQTVDSVMIDIQKSAIQIENYTKRNSLSIHPDKCESFILSKKKFVGPLVEIKSAGKSVKVVDSSKCLEITIDNDLTWDLHT